MDIWTPVMDQTLLVKREPTNPKDKNAVAIHEEDSIVGHLQFTFELYLQWNLNCPNPSYPTALIISTLILRDLTLFLTYNLSCINLFLHSNIQL